MIRYGFEDQDFFAIDPVRYAAALGDKGLAVYRAEVEDRLERGDGSFHVQVAQERIAVLDGDIEAIVRLLGGDLSGPYHFIRVAKAMQELGRDDEVLAWAERGIEETTGWQVGRLYDLAAEVYASRGHLAERLALRRQQHVRMPSTRTYGLLRDAAEPTGSWSSEQGAARSLLAPGDLVDVLLGDGEPSAAWQVRIDNPAWDPGADRLMRLAEAREPQHPEDALATYLQLAGLALETADRAAYERAAAILKRARTAAQADGQSEAFHSHVADLRERYRRRPTLIKILDRARLS